MSAWTETLGFVLALAMVLCSIRELHWSWPLAMASSVLYFFVFRDTGLYAEAGLQIVFVLLAMWGWWQWLRGHRVASQGLQIASLGRSGWTTIAVALVLLWPALAWLLIQHTDSTLPWWDALPTALSLIGQVLLGRKRIENWLVWLLANLISVGLFAKQGLWLTSLLYLLFAALSLMGWRAWRQRLQLVP